MDSGIGRVSVGLPDTANEVQVVPTQGSIGQGPGEAHAQRVETAENTYQYQPLLPGHIRCLALHSGTEESDIEISLMPFSLQDDPDSILQVMEALSYTWGSPTPAKTIYTHDEPRKTLTVSPNLHDALIGLRQTDTGDSGGRILWIDQLCINQQDNDEKSKQVRLMGTIYSKAERVIMWLSKEIFHLKDLNFYLGKFLDLYRASAAGTTEGSLAQGIQDESLLAAANRIPQRSWDIAQIMFGHPYFTRIWMIQEVVMAKQCYVLLEDGVVEWKILQAIGSILSDFNENLDMIPFPVTMRKPLRCLQKMMTLRLQVVEFPKLGPLATPLASSLSDPNLDVDHKLSVTQAIKWVEGRRWSLLDFAQKAWQFNASDRRDKVYALLGLLAFDHCCLGSPTQLYPDYSSTKTYQQLLRDVTTTSFTQYGSLSTLVFCNPRRNFRLPSWLFDVEDPHAADMGYELGYILSKFSASRSGVASVLANLDDASVLSFKITRIGTLLRLAPVSVDEVLQADLEQRREQDPHYDPYTFLFNLANVSKMVLTSWSTAVDTADTIPVPDGLLLKNLFRAFMCDIGSSGKRLPAEIGGVELEAFEGLIKGSQEAAVKLLDDNACAYFCLALKRVRGMQFCRRLQWTSAENDVEDEAPLSSLLCWTPKEGEIGDLLAVVHGFPLPMLMRRVPGSEQYRFLGICYVHGFMDGEALARDDFKSEYVAVC